MIKRIFAMLLALVLAMGCAAAESADAPAAARRIELKTYPLYLFSPGEQWPDGFPLYFADGVYDLPLVELDDWAALVNKAFPQIGEGLYDGYQLTVTKGETLRDVRLVRENGYDMCFDFVDGTLSWTDYDAFMMQTNGRYFDLASIPDTDKLGRTTLLHKVSSRDRFGEEKVISLKEYDIRMIAQDGKCLLPLQTMAAFFFSRFELGMYFNGQALFMSNIESMRDPMEAMLYQLITTGTVTEEEVAQVQQGDGTPEDKMNALIGVIMKTEEGKQIFLQSQQESENSLYELYTSAPKAPRSAELALFGYNELCLELDCFYGLKGPHNIKNFSTYFAQLGLLTDLIDPDAGKADAAVAALTNYWIDDGHSSFISASYLTQDEPTTGIEDGISYINRDRQGTYAAASRALFPEASQGYYEVGNTAYITFDNFDIGTDENNEILDYYALAAEDNLPNDTVGLIIKAHRQITRENSPIENVVLDLSCNTGGAAPAAVYTLGWFLGDAQVSIQSSFTGAESTAIYRADVNLDHQFDDKDSISNLNLYCLISPKSFSCANLVPWAFKADGRVTLLGRVSGGGSCVVMALTTAWGASFTISGYERLSFIKNGSYYDVDQGVEPDYIINRYGHFYDRKALTEYIQRLY